MTQVFLLSHRPALPKHLHNSATERMEHIASHQTTVLRGEVTIISVNHWIVGTAETKTCGPRAVVETMIFDYNINNR